MTKPDKSNTEFNNLYDIFKVLFDSKFALIIITFLITGVASSYLIINKPQPIYKSMGLIEIGDYFDINDKQKKLIETSSSLNTELNKIFINRYLYDKTKKNFVTLINPLQEGMIKLEARSSSIEQAEKSILEIIDFVISRHEYYFENIQDKSYESIELEKNILINSLSSLKNRERYIKNIEMPLIASDISARIFEIELFNELIRESIKKDSAEVNANAELRLRSNLDEIKEINLTQEISLLENEHKLEALKNQIDIIEKRVAKIDYNFGLIKSNSNFNNSRLVGQIITSTEPQPSSKLIIISTLIIGLILSCCIILVANSIMGSKR